MDKKIVVVVQCHIVKEYCSGYFCEYHFTDRSGGFAIYPKNKKLRIITLTCGGCCGRAVHRKLSHLIKRLKRFEKIDKDKIMVHLSSCIAFDNYHGPVCPHKQYLKTIIENKLELELVEGSKVSTLAAKRRKEGVYPNKQKS
jgi:predicted metal-binding protein